MKQYLVSGYLQRKMIQSCLLDFGHFTPITQGSSYKAVSYPGGLWWARRYCLSCRLSADGPRKGFDFAGGLCSGSLFFFSPCFCLNQSSWGVLI